METVISADAVDRAVELLSLGDPVALPTETVYGLAADATRSDECDDSAKLLPDWRVRNRQNQRCRE